MPEMCCKAHRYYVRLTLGEPIKGLEQLAFVAKRRCHSDSGLGKRICRVHAEA
jgi:hypothetical protein